MSGHLVVAPEDRDAYLDDCREVVTAGRAAAGCLDFALSPDLVDDGRINILERWTDADSLAAFRGSGVDDSQASQILEASVSEYDVAEERKL